MVCLQRYAYECTLAAAVPACNSGAAALRMHAVNWLRNIDWRMQSGSQDAAEDAVPAEGGARCGNQRCLAGVSQRQVCNACHNASGSMRVQWWGSTGDMPVHVQIGTYLQSLICESAIQPLLKHFRSISICWRYV